MDRIPIRPSRKTGSVADPRKKPDPYPALEKKKNPNPYSTLKKNPDPYLIIEKNGTVFEPREKPERTDNVTTTHFHPQYILKHSTLILTLDIRILFYVQYLQIPEKFWILLRFFLTQLRIYSIFGSGSEA